jgi:molecular chaperone DnaJ
MAKDYYNILGVTKTASADEIKAAFRKLAHKHHPDKGGSAEKFKEINEAYQVVGNKEKREQYDRFGSAYQNSAGGQGAGAGAGGFGGFNAGGYDINMDDLGDMFGGFGDIFGFGGGGSSRQNRARRGRDIELELSLDFNEAVFGAEKEISYKHVAACAACGGSGAAPGSKSETCKTCGGRGRVAKMQRTILGTMQVESVCPECQGNGKINSKNCSECGGEGQKNQTATFKVKIPAGIDNGESLRLSGRGDAGEKGAPTGDLFLHIKIKPHAGWERRGSDIHSHLEIDVKQAMLGDEVKVKTVDGDLTLKIPAGTQPDTIFRLREHGVPKLHGRGRGDHLVAVSVKIPKTLSRHDQKLVEEMKL